MKKLLTIASLFLVTGSIAQELSMGEKVANTAMTIWGDTLNFRKSGPPHWSYDRGVIMKGLEYTWYNTGNPKYYNSIKTSMDAFVDKDGNIRDYDPKEYNIDHVLCGRALLTLYKVTGEEKYFKAATTIRNQLKTHPRTKEGGFWHKKRYPWQMWLDGLYMGEPFYAEYAALTKEDTAFNDIANQFIWMENHARDAKTGLLYHGWDESKEQKWANKQTGLSPHFWARAMGWYGMALVDALEWFPADHPKRKALIDILNRFAVASQKVQDPATGLWWDIMDLPNKGKNYLEASASCMLVYTFAKGARLGYLPASFNAPAKKGYDGVVKKFIETDAQGLTNLNGTVSVSGLGGDPYRDGSFDYYMSEKVIVNDAKGVGAFIKMAAEMERTKTLNVAKGKKVTLDYYFNNEAFRKFAGTTVRTHYTWNEMSHGGFTLLKYIFESYGAKTAQLETAPTAANLKGTDVYIIVDPDGLKDNKNPNYMDDASAKAIAEWVKQGGSLLLMANDSSNCDLKHFNKLANIFGITFSDRGRNFVQGDQFETGAVLIPTANEVFKTTKKTYLKEVSIIDVKAPAKPLVSKENDIIMAVANYGKGKVFAVGDPWLYNEYTDGRKIPAEYENFSAATELAKWLLQAKK